MLSHTGQTFTPSSEMVIEFSCGTNPLFSAALGPKFPRTDGPDRPPSALISMSTLRDGTREILRERGPIGRSERTIDTTSRPTRVSHGAIDRFTYTMTNS